MRICVLAGFLLMGIALPVSPVGAWLAQKGVSVLDRTVWLGDGAFLEVQQSQVFWTDLGGVMVP